MSALLPTWQSTMEPSFRQLLVDRAIHVDLIDFLQAEGITTMVKLANYCDSRAEVQALLVDRVTSTRGRRKAKAALTELWRESDCAEELRLKRKASGVEQDDLEDPLPELVLSSTLSRFETAYSYKLSLKEVLCDPLLGRMKREIDRKASASSEFERHGSCPETRQERGSVWART